MTRLSQYLSLDYYRLKRLKRILAQINQLQPTYAAMTDQELQAQTPAFKERLAAGESLDQILPEAFALVREVDKRLLGQFPYDVQVLGALVMHQGHLAEMKTGEGKTLTATMPLYLNALAHPGVMLVTTNSYLALRDAEEMGPVYRFLGLRVAKGVPENPNQQLTPAEKQAIYSADIIYTTNWGLGFDYLMDNLAKTKKERYGIPFSYAIVDEADSVLLDSAQTPLVISGAPRLQSNLYDLANSFILTLKKDQDYKVERERKDVWLTPKGIDHAERYFDLEDFYRSQNIELIRHVNLALRAHVNYELGKDYLVEAGKIKLLDQANGRLLESTKLQGGQHQALEAKEGLEISQEMRAMAAITYQNLFTMFDKLAGMTGTGKPSEAEFIETYDMEVVRIPTNKPVIRQDYPDQIYTTLPEKVAAIMAMVRRIHATGQPILMVTGSVRLSELFSEILLLEGIPHNLLNAANEAKEAQMIAEAGQKGSLTLATNMAGRGTDIKLSQEVKELGGLAVIATEHMANERMDQQIRGRAGRQGDPGMSQFFVCLEDELITKYGGEKLAAYLEKYRDQRDEHAPLMLTGRRFKRMVAHAQETSDSLSQQSRRQTQEFDKSVKRQRDLVYQERTAILNGSSSGFSTQTIIRQAIEQFLDQESHWSPATIERFIFDNISYSFAGFPEDLDWADKEALVAYLLSLTQAELARKEALIGQDMALFEQTVVLRAIDEMWIEEVDFLQQLRLVVTGRVTAQRNPAFEYHTQALASYQTMAKDLNSLALKYLMLSDVSYTKDDKLEIQFL